MATSSGPDADRGATVFLFRAVNVGGATLPMADLRAWANELGADRVRTHIASGNLIAVPPEDPEAFARRLEQVVQERRGFFREVIVRDPDDLRRALDDHPFEVRERKFSYVGFMPAAPSAEAIEKARGYPTGDDRWEVIGRDLHIRFADGAGRPEMKTDSVLRSLAVPCTMRNLSTVAALIDKATA